MTTKTYTNRSNCARAAKAALGKTAKPGVDFTITGEGKEWTWAAVVKEPTSAAPKAPRRKREGAPRNITEQPRMVQFQEAIQKAGEAGITALDIANKYNVQPHTVRGAISRLIKAGAPIGAYRHEKRVRYRSKIHWSDAAA